MNSLVERLCARLDKWISQQRRGITAATQIQRWRTREASSTKDPASVGFSGDYTHTRASLTLADAQIKRDTPDPASGNSSSMGSAGLVDGLGGPIVGIAREHMPASINPNLPRLFGEGELVARLPKLLL